MTWLKRSDWEFVGLDEGLRRAEDPHHAKRFIVLTFDDGYRDTLTRALPILARHAAPFTVYVPTSAVTRTLDAWWLALRELIRSRDSVTIDAMGETIDCGDLAIPCVTLQPVRIATGDICDPQGLALTTQKELDDNGNVSVDYDAAKNAKRTIYDAANNPCFSIDPKGYVTQADFNSENRKIRQRVYLQKIDPKQFNNNTTVADVEKVMQGKQSAEDTLTHYFYNDIGNLRFTVNSFGAVTETLYDLLSRKIGTLEYQGQSRSRQIRSINHSCIGGLSQSSGFKKSFEFLHFRWK